MLLRVKANSTLDQIAKRLEHHEFYGTYLGDPIKDVEQLLDILCGITYAVDLAYRDMNTSEILPNSDNMEVRP